MLGIATFCPSALVEAVAVGGSGCCGVVVCPGLFIGHKHDKLTHWEGTSYLKGLTAEALIGPRALPHFEELL